MNDEFVLCYTAWHERELTLADMRQMLLGDLGEAGLVAAISEFREERLKREQQGDWRTYYEIMKQ
jgi:hypothetical protein